MCSSDLRAMPTNVIMPQMGESIAEGTLTRWLKKPGDSVKRDEPLFEISTDKVDAEIPAPSAGVLLGILVTEGQTVPIDSVVAYIGAADERVPTDRQSAPQPAAPALAGPAPAAPPRSVLAPTPPVVAPAVPEPAPAAPPPVVEGGPRRTSPLVRRMAKEHSVDLARVTGTGLGGRVTKRDVEAYLHARLVASSPAPSGDGVERRRRG